MSSNKSVAGADELWNTINLPDALAEKRDSYKEEDTFRIFAVTSSLLPEPVCKSRDPVCIVKTTLSLSLSPVPFPQNTVKGT